MKILLLSAYDAPSHRYWHQFLQNHMPQYQWEVLTLPPRYFSWRIRGNSLTWAFHKTLAQASSFDCLIATSMVDLAALRGMVPALTQLPTLLYFHENQFSYPVSEHQRASIEPQMVSLYSAISADQLVFNSQYNRDSFLQGVSDLLDKFPDCVPKGVVSELEAKSRCIPVPVQAVATGTVNKCSKKLQIIWNHRWEYDKGPELLAECIGRLPNDLALTFHVVGQRFRTSPKIFESIYASLNARGWLGEWGFMEKREDYEGLLNRSHVVLSTAKHDFQGLSVLEAVAAGCVPVVPNRLAYKEWFSSCYRYTDQGDEADQLCLRLESLAIDYKAGRGFKVPSVESFTWPKLGPQYQQSIAELMAIKKER